MCVPWPPPGPGAPLPAGPGAGRGPGLLGRARPGLCGPGNTGAGVLAVSRVLVTALPASPGVSLRRETGTSEPVSSHTQRERTVSYRDMTVSTE